MKAQLAEAENKEFEFEMQVEALIEYNKLAKDCDEEEVTVEEMKQSLDQKENILKQVGE